MVLSLPTGQPPRSHKGTTLLSPRDRWGFQWIGEQYALCLDHLQVLLGRRAGAGAKQANWISASAVRQVLARWHKLGYIEQKSIFTDSPAWIWLTRRGLSELGLRYSFYTPHFATLPHLHAINHVRLSLEQLHPHDRWQSERSLKSLRPRYAAGSEPPHTPDAEWHSHQTNEVTSVEVELSVKKARELRAILTDLAGRYPSIWYFALEAPYRALQDVLSTLDNSIQERVYLYRLEDLHDYRPLAL